MNAVKTHKSTQRRYWHLGWAQPQELQPPKKDQSWCKAGFIFIDKKNHSHITKTVCKRKLENVLIHGCTKVRK